MPNLLTLVQLRELVQSTVDDLSVWFVAKPRLFASAHPEQQVQFELAARLRDQVRQTTNNATWDRLHFDASGASVPQGPGIAAVPIFVDTRQILGVVATKDRSAAEPDVAIAVHVLRTAERNVEYDDNANLVGRVAPPVNLFAQGALLDQRVDQLERLSHRGCDGTLVVVYSNEARRKSAVDSREVASWAAWQKPLDTLWWTVRHFRAKAR